MSYMNTIASANRPSDTRASDKIADFADRMHRIPRVVVTCEVYGTKSAAVDRAHAMAIFRKVFGHVATPNACYVALSILQDRLDDDQSRGYQRP